MQEGKWHSFYQGGKSFPEPHGKLPSFLFGQVICLCLSCKLAGKVGVYCGRETLLMIHRGADMAVRQAVERVLHEPHVLP